jgi:hypothetical protein
VTGPGARARRRSALALLCALTGIAVVAVVAGREVSRVSPDDEPRVGATLPGAVASEDGVRAGAVLTPPPAAPVAAPRMRRDDGGAVVARPERVESPSFESDDWRDRVAAVLGRQFVEGSPRNPGAVHTHLHSTDGVMPETRAPAVETSTPGSGPRGMEGWDGGDFWFGPNGLVKVKEAQR